MRGVRSSRSCVSDLRPSAGGCRGLGGDGRWDSPRVPDLGPGGRLGCRERERGLSAWKELGSRVCPVPGTCSSRGSPSRGGGCTSVGERHQSCVCSLRVWDPGLYPVHLEYS